MEPLLDLPIDQFFGALDELGLGPERRADLLREYRRRNSAFSPVYGLLDSVADEDAAQGMQRADIVPISRPEGMSVFDAIRSGDWRLAVPQGALDAVGDVAGALDVPAAAASGLIPREDMVGEALNAAGAIMGLGGLLARPAGSLGTGGRLYRAERENYENPGEGAVYYSPDRQYVENYNSPDRVLRQASIPENVIDTTTPSGRASVRSWLEQELSRYRQRAESGEIRGGPDLRDLERILARDELSFEETSRALALLDVLEAPALGRIPVGASQRRFMDDVGVDAMTVRESDGSLSYAFRSPEIAQSYWFDGELSANRSTAGGLLASAAETPAQRVARLLRNGRADEVTDDLMAQADPQEMYQLYVSGETGMDLPMDEASRMARAREMGFDTETPLYHGTWENEDFAAFNPSMRGRIGPGVYLSPDPEKANRFTGIGYGDEAFMMQNHTPRNVSVFASGNRHPDMDVRQDVRRIADELGDRGSETSYQATRDGFAERGYSGVSVADEVAIHDPTNIRSRFARFDPRLSHLANLNAANIDPLTGAAAMGASQQQQDPLASLRAYLAQNGLLSQ